MQFHKCVYNFDKIDDIEVGETWMKFCRSGKLLFYYDNPNFTFECNYLFMCDICSVVSRRIWDGLDSFFKRIIEEMVRDTRKDEKHIFIHLAYVYYYLDCNRMGRNGS